MFTGIIQTLGTIESINRISQGMAYQITVPEKDIFSNSNIGDSISVDGVCQTIEKINSNMAEFHALNVTLEKTTLKNISTRQKVNIETALKFGDKIGGHLISGHVGCVGKIISLKKLGKSHLLTIKIDSQNSKYLFEEGSIAINGISLTVSKMITSCIFEVSVIPHTFNHTNLQFKKVNHLINVEIDLISKNVHHAINHKRGYHALFS